MSYDIAFGVLAREKVVAVVGLQREQRVIRRRR
jgi:hypothetical protein